MEKFFNLSLLKRLVSGLILITILFSIFLFWTEYISIFLVAILAIILIFEWPKLFSYKDKQFWLIMPFYPILPFVFLILLNNETYSILLFVTLILSFVLDTGSYIAGRLFGRHKICPVSPGKTWEGFLGGFLSVILAFKYILYVVDKTISWPLLLLLSFVISFVGLIGDLFESYLKRRARIKDSGFMLPGHGGFLDRFDSIMFVGTFFYIFRNYLIKLF